MIKLKFKRLSEDDKTLIKKLTNEGKSLRDISKVTGLGITTIYYQVRKFKPKLKKDFVVKLNDFQIGELIGAFAGDGSYSHKKYDRRFPQKSSHYKINYYLTYPKEIQYASYLKNLLNSLNLNPFNYIREGTIMVGVNSKEYYYFIKRYLIWEQDKTVTIRLTNKSALSGDFLKGFARGLMDTDGYVEISNVSCACISRVLINDLIYIFRKYNLTYKLTERKREGKRPLFLVRVYRDSLEKYKELIGFSNQHKINSLNKILEKTKSKVLKNT